MTTFQGCIPETLFLLNGFRCKRMVMKMKTWRKHHKWIGLAVSFFLVMFCVSGIVLNHRNLVHDWNVNRGLLPPSYRFENWDKGFLRGTLPCRMDGERKVLMYGYEGCWLTDSIAKSFGDFNRGLPNGCDLRSLRAVVQMPDGRIWAAGQFGCYVRKGSMNGAWAEVELPLSDGERISDLYARGDTLLVVGRSFLYRALPPYNRFVRLELKAPAGYDGKVSLFRTVWLLHSGELFGSAGRAVLDLTALVLVFLCISGWFYLLLPRRVVWRRRFFFWHDKVGVKTILLTVFIVFTGWCLRPPVLIALVKGRLPAIPGTSLYSHNPWHDNLRMLRYDERSGEWLMSTSEGFYKLRSLQAVPVKITPAPPVSVMGLNVWEKDTDGNWLVGSFSGMFRWNPRTGIITDFFTGKPAEARPGPPFGARPVSGFTADFHHRPGVIEYENGSGFAEMPESFTTLPMSLWDFALEVHSGRIYVYDNLASMVFIFFAGIVVVYTLWTGYRIRVKHPKKKPVAGKQAIRLHK